MNDKIIFREMLTEIGKLAEENENKLTIDEIKDFFKKVSLTDEQMELVYSYLEANKIIVEGHKKSDTIKLFQANEKNEVSDKEENKQTNNVLNEEENKYLTMYLEELGTLPTLNEQEKLELYSQVLKGDSLAKSRVIEIYLSTVVEVAKRYQNKSIPMSDLIQEGNVGLMLVLDELDGNIEINQFEETLICGIEAAMEEIIEENDTLKLTNNKIISKVNFLNEGAKNLEEELERKASIAELAKYMEMSEEEVRDIIRVSDNEIKVKENEEKQKE